MKKIGLSGTETLTPKGKPSVSLKSKSMGSESNGRSDSAVTGLKAKSLGHKSLGRNADAITKLRAPKTTGAI